jgi:hypothetical protein
VPGAHKVVYNCKEYAASDGQNNVPGAKLVWGPFHCPGIIGTLINGYAHLHHHRLFQLLANYDGPNRYQLCTGHVNNIILVVITPGDIATDATVKEQNRNHQVREVDTPGGRERACDYIGAGICISIIHSRISNSSRCNIHASSQIGYYLPPGVPMMPGQWNGPHTSFAPGTLTISSSLSSSSQIGYYLPPGVSTSRT